MFALSSLYIKVCNNLLCDRLIGISFTPSGLHFEVSVMSYFSFSASSPVQEGLFCFCTCFATCYPTSLVRDSCTWILLDLKNFCWVVLCYSQVLIKCQHWGGWERNAGGQDGRLLFPSVSSWFLIIWYYQVYAPTLELIRAIENCYRGQNTVWSVICLLYRASTFSYNFLERLIPSFSSEHSVQAFL